MPPLQMTLIMSTIKKRIQSSHVLFEFIPFKVAEKFTRQTNGFQIDVSQKIRNKTRETRQQIVSDSGNVMSDKDNRKEAHAN